MEVEHISLNKFISDTGLCSRREADKIIEAGRVMINQVVARKGNRVSIGDSVTIDGEEVGNKPKTIYIAFNKPIGIVCTTDDREPDNIISHLNYSERIFPIGRLDKMSQGLILLTNDGDIVNKILRAGNAHEKEYIVRVQQKIDSAFIKSMSTGVPILDRVTNPCQVFEIDHFTFRIILKQGLNRQIRRMCEFLGYQVVSLTRTRIMHIDLRGLDNDKWRYLTQQEIDEMMLQVAHSSK